MKRTLAFILSVIMVLGMVPASLLSVLANGPGVAANSTPNLSLDNATVEKTFLPASIEVDGELNDTGWIRDQWNDVNSATGSWNVETPKDSNLNYEYQIQRDYQFLYGAYIVDMDTVFSGMPITLTIWLNDGISSQDNWTQKVEITVSESNGEYTTAMSRWYYDSASGTAKPVSEEIYTSMYLADPSYYPEYYTSSGAVEGSDIAEGPQHTVIENDGDLVVEFRTLLDVFNDQKDYDEYKAANNDSADGYTYNQNDSSTFLSNQKTVTHFTAVNCGNAAVGDVKEQLFFPRLNVGNEMQSPEVKWPEGANSITGADVMNTGNADYNNVLPSGIDVDGEFTEGAWSYLTNYYQALRDDAYSGIDTMDDFRANGLYDAVDLTVHNNLWYASSADVLAYVNSLPEDERSQAVLNDQIFGSPLYSNGVSFLPAGETYDRDTNGNGTIDADETGLISTDSIRYTPDSTNTDTVRFKYSSGSDDRYFYGGMVVYSDVNVSNELTIQLDIADWTDATETAVAERGEQEGSGSATEGAKFTTYAIQLGSYDDTEVNGSTYGQDDIKIISYNRRLGGGYDESTKIGGYAGNYSVNGSDVTVESMTGDNAIICNLNQLTVGGTTTEITSIDYGITAQRVSPYLVQVIWKIPLSEIYLEDGDATNNDANNGRDKNDGPTDFGFRFVVADGNLNVAKSGTYDHGVNDDEQFYYRSQDGYDPANYTYDGDIYRWASGWQIIFEYDTAYENKEYKPADSCIDLSKGVLNSDLWMNLSAADDHVDYVVEASGTHAVYHQSVGESGYDIAEDDRLGDIDSFNYQFYTDNEYLYGSVVIWQDKDKSDGVSEWEKSTGLEPTTATDSFKLFVNDGAWSEDNKTTDVTLSFYLDKYSRTRVYLTSSKYTTLDGTAFSWNCYDPEGIQAAMTTSTGTYQDGSAVWDSDDNKYVRQQYTEVQLEFKIPLYYFFTDVAQGTPDYSDVDLFNVMCYAGNYGNAYGIYHSHNYAGDVFQLYADTDTSYTSPLYRGTFPVFSTSPVKSYPSWLSMINDCLPNFDSSKQLTSGTYVVNYTGWPQYGDITFKYGSRDNSGYYWDNFILDGKLEEYYWNTEEERVSVDNSNGYWAKVPASNDDIDYEYRIYTSPEYVYGGIKLNKAAVEGETRFYVWFDVDEGDLKDTNIEGATHRLEFWFDKLDISEEDYYFEEESYNLVYKLYDNNGEEIATKSLSKEGIEKQYLFAKAKTINDETVLEFMLDIDLLDLASEEDGYANTITVPSGVQYGAALPSYADWARDGFEYVVGVRHPVEDETLTLYHTGNGNETFWISGYDRNLYADGVGLVLDTMPETLPAYADLMIFVPTAYDDVYTLDYYIPRGTNVSNYTIDYTLPEGAFIYLVHGGDNFFTSITETWAVQQGYGDRRTASTEFITDIKSIIGTTSFTGGEYMFKFENLNISANKDYYYYDTVPNTVELAYVSQPAPDVLTNIATSVGLYDEGYASLTRYACFTAGGALDAESFPDYAGRWSSRALNINALLDYQIEEITIDGEVTGEAWDNYDWTYVDSDVNSNLQAEGASTNVAADEFAYKYKVTTDGEYFYVSAILNTDMEDTHFRIWTNNASMRDVTNNGAEYTRVTFDKLFEIAQGRDTANNTLAIDEASIQAMLDSRTYLNGWSITNVDMNRLGTGVLDAELDAANKTIKYTGDYYLRAVEFNETVDGNVNDDEFTIMNPNGGLADENRDHYSYTTDSYDNSEANNGRWDPVDADRDGLVDTTPTTNALTYGQSAFFGETKIREENTTDGENTNDDYIASGEQNGGWIAERKLEEITYGYEHAVMKEITETDSNGNSVQRTVVEFKLHLDEIADENGEFEYYFTAYKSTSDKPAEDFCQIYPMADMEIGVDFSTYDGFYFPHWYFGTTALEYNADVERDLKLRAPYVPVTNIGGQYDSEYFTDATTGEVTNALRLGVYYREEYISRQMRDDYLKKFTDANGNAYEGYELTAGWDYWDVLEMGLIVCPSELMDTEIKLDTTTNVDPNYATDVEADRILKYNEPEDTNFGDYQSFVYYAVITNIPASAMNYKYSYRAYVDYYGNDGRDTYEARAGQDYYLDYYQAEDTCEYYDKETLESYNIYDEAVLEEYGVTDVEAYGKYYMEYDADGNMVVDENGEPVAKYDEFHAPIMTRSISMMYDDIIEYQKLHATVDTVTPEEEDSDASPVGTTIGYLAETADWDAKWWSEGNSINELTDYDTEYHTNSVDIERADMLAELAGFDIYRPALGMDSGNIGAQTEGGIKQWVVSLAYHINASDGSRTYTYRDPKIVEAIVEHGGQVILTADFHEANLTAATGYTFEDYYIINGKDYRESGDVTFIHDLNSEALGMMGIAMWATKLYGGVNLHVSYYGDEMSTVDAYMDEFNSTINPNNTEGIEVLVLTSTKPEDVNNLIDDLSDNLSETIPTIVISYVKEGTAYGYKYNDTHKDVTTDDLVPFEDLLISVPNIGRMLSYSSWNRDDVSNYYRPTTVALSAGIARYTYLKNGLPKLDLTVAENVARVEKANKAFVKYQTFSLVSDIAYAIDFANAGEAEGETTDLITELLAFKNKAFQIKADAIANYINCSDIVTGITANAYKYEECETDKFNETVLVGRVQYDYSAGTFMDNRVGGIYDAFDIMFTGGANVAYEQYDNGTSTAPDDKIITNFWPTTDEYGTETGKATFNSNGDSEGLPYVMPLSSGGYSYTGKLWSYTFGGEFKPVAGTADDYVAKYGDQYFKDATYVDYSGDLNDGVVSETIINNVLLDDGTAIDGYASGNWFAFIDDRIAYDDSQYYTDAVGTVIQKSYVENGVTKYYDYEITEEDKLGVFAQYSMDGQASVNHSQMSGLLTYQNTAEYQNSTYGSQNYVYVPTDYQSSVNSLKWLFSADDWCVNRSYDMFTNANCTGEGFYNSTSFASDTRWMSHTWYNTESGSGESLESEKTYQYGYGEIVIDLGAVTDLSAVRLHLANVKTAMSFAPDAIEVYVANDIDELCAVNVETLYNATTEVDTNGDGVMETVPVSGGGVNNDWDKYWNYHSNYVTRVYPEYTLNDEHIYWTTADMGDAKGQYVMFRFQLSNGDTYFVDEIEVYADPTTETSVPNNSKGDQDYFYVGTVDANGLNDVIATTDKSQAQVYGEALGGVSGNWDTTMAQLDVVFLQGIKQFSATDIENEIKIIAQAAGYPYYYYAKDNEDDMLSTTITKDGGNSFANGLYSEVVDNPSSSMDDSSTGVAILSKYPITAARTYYSKNGGSSIAYAEVNYYGAYIDVYSVDFAGSNSNELNWFTKADEYAQLKHILSNRSEYAIVAGDFNEDYYEDYILSTGLASTPTVGDQESGDRVQVYETILFDTEGKLSLPGNSGGSVWNFFSNYGASLRSGFYITLP